MLTDYFIVASAVAVASLAWWNWLDDHPAFHARVKRLPGIGHPLDCSFCFPLWLTFFTLLFIRPLAPHIGAMNLWDGPVGYTARFILEWLSLGASVLLIRHTIFMIREIGAVYNHQHRKNHEHELA